jgi:hypothetical protein
MHSTTALHQITNLISKGFNQSKPPKRTVLVALDLTKAFNSVDITLLLEQMAHSDLHPNIVQWLTTYLRGRSAAVVYQGVRSAFRNIHMGVPQGSILSPALFNHFVSDCPNTKGLRVMFADDLSAAASALDLQSIKETFNSDMVIIAAWVKRKGLSISPEKSQVTFFTSNRWETNVHPQIFFEGALIPLVKKPRNLGLILDPHHTGNANSMNILSKIPSRAKVINAVTNSSFGLSREDALLTYRATVEPVINQCVPLWKPIVSETWLSKIQAAQNNILRQMLGCHAATSMAHLHQEAKIMTIRNILTYNPPSFSQMPCSLTIRPIV